MFIVSNSKHTQRKITNSLFVFTLVSLIFYSVIKKYLIFKRIVGQISDYSLESINSFQSKESSGQLIRCYFESPFGAQVENTPGSWVFVNSESAVNILGSHSQQLVDHFGLDNCVIHLDCAKNSSSQWKLPHFGSGTMDQIEIDYVESMLHFSNAIDISKKVAHKAKVLHGILLKLSDNDIVKLREHCFPEGKYDEITLERGIKYGKKLLSKKEKLQIVQNQNQHQTTTIVNTNVMVDKRQSNPVTNVQNHQHHYIQQNTHNHLTVVQVASEEQRQLTQAFVELTSQMKEMKQELSKIEEKMEETEMVEKRDNVHLTSYKINVEFKKILEVNLQKQNDMERMLSGMKMKVLQLTEKENLAEKTGDTKSANIGNFTMATRKAVRWKQEKEVKEDKEEKEVRKRMIPMSEEAIQM